jgi:hypothetical protein
MGKILLPSSLRLFKRGRRIEMALVAYFVSLLVVAATSGIWHIMAFAAALGLTIWTLYMFETELSPVVRSINYDNLGANGRGSQQISHFIASFISFSLLAILLVAFIFQYAWWLSLAVMAGYALALLMLMRHYSKVLRSPMISSAIRSPRPWPIEAAALMTLPHKPSADHKKGEPSPAASIIAATTDEREAHGKWKYL